MQTTLKGNKVLFELSLGEIDNDILSFLSTLKIARKSRAKEKEIFRLSEEIKEKWWKKNKKKFIDENSNRRR
ncbi:MAG: hypothetical protein HZA10_04325 [Nitrospirae bacterium]|nr:hypothetical protein [Nitrospirota bacterium]